MTGAPNPTYEAAHASETAGSITLDLIMTEKYVALFTQCETWSDWRRTNIPLLTPNPSGVVNGIPRILPTSQEERNYNPNAIVVGNVLQKSMVGSVIQKTFLCTKARALVRAFLFSF